jgi:hypothetical protein
MALPLVPFAAGVAVGAVAIYGWRDPAMREQFARGGEWLYDTTVGLLGGLLGVARPAADAAAGLAAEAVEQVERVVAGETPAAAPSVEAAQAAPPRTRGTRAAVKKATTKRAPARKTVSAETTSAASRRPRRKKTEE